MTRLKTLALLPAFCACAATAQTYPANPRWAKVVKNAGVKPQ